MTPLAPCPNSRSTFMPLTMATAGVNKLFILDKYFTELTKFWQSEYQGQGAERTAQSTSYSQSQHHYFQRAALGRILESGHLVSNLAQVSDLIHLEGPITEDSIIRALHSRYLADDLFTNIGPVLISINPYHDRHNPLTLTSAHQHAACYPLLRIVHEAVRQQNETGYPQAIILSGSSGSGKTYSSMVILRQLFNVVGGGSETDAFKHLAATFTVLRSLGSAKTTANSESSRIGNFIEVQVSEGAIYRTKIHCYFLDQFRLIKTPQKEKNYHIFYQMLAGLSPSEKTKLYLDEYSVSSFNYLKNGSHEYNHSEDATRFEAWKSCLSVLGIPFIDVARVLAAILLLGNVVFEESGEEKQLEEVDCKSFNKELHAVASLLGVSSATLHKALVTRTHSSSKSQVTKSKRTVTQSESVRDSLARALYIRTVATIIRRANSSKRLGSTCGTASSESNESVHNHLEISSSHHPPSSIGSACGKSYKTMAILNNAVRYSMDGFIGILDMFGFENCNPSRLEQLCINLCAETMQHFYNTHIFKSSIESCRDEGIKAEIEIEYVDNVPCIDLISSLRTGLFSLLDQECAKSNTAETFVQRMNSQHHSNARYINQANVPEKPEPNYCFGIKHYGGNVIYDASYFLESNSDRLCDEVVSVFHKSQCSVGFVSHLFGAELRVLNSKGGKPCGITFRVAPTSRLDANSHEPTSTLTQDFHTRLDNLLRTLVHARPHFIRCVKINDIEKCGHFDKLSIRRQVRALQILETVNLMAGGLPHRMRFKAFISRYRILVRTKLLKRQEDKMVDDCKVILEQFAIIRPQLNYISAASTSLVLGKKHIFLSESARQQLEIARNKRRMTAATLIQAAWRGFHLRCQWVTIRQSLLASRLMINAPSRLSCESTLGHRSKPRPQPITRTPPPFGPQGAPTKSIEMCDFNIVKETCALLGIDLSLTPPLPPSRSYTVVGNAKCFFPQLRTFKLDFTDPVSKVHIKKGQKSIVLSFSSKRGYFCTQFKNSTLDIPYQYFEQFILQIENELNI